MRYEVWGMGFCGNQRRSGTLEKNGIHRVFCGNNGSCKPLYIYARNCQNPYPMQTKKSSVIRYFYDKVTGTFAGFMIAFAATGLVSQFFETRSIRNLWGLTAKKTVIDKQSFVYLEWIISVVIGFIVFEMLTKVVKKKLDEVLPKYKIAVFRIIIQYDLHHKFSRALNRR